MRFDHVGVATRDAAALADRYAALFDAPVIHRETLDGLRVVFLELEAGGYLELLEPVADGTVARFLDREGPGMHHVGIATDDIADALASARAHGVELVDDEPRPGAWGHDVAFLHPGSTGGMLVEFVER